MRRQPERATFPKILIVCEGEKTEPNYFNGLRDELKLSNARVEITGKGASNPMGVVSFAEKRHKEDKDAGFPF
ncbi:MAG: RloB family protein, partial [Gammaproteobacteria bacterium]|nr:RloB family protein [Gammaproteobacteria bacterium]